MWMLFYPEKVPRRAVEILSNLDNKFFYSIASMWEVAIKHRKHPKAMEHSGVEFLHYCEAMGFHKIEINDRHVCALETLSQKEDSSVHDEPYVFIV